MLWGLSRQSAGKVLRCWGQRGKEEKRKKKPRVTWNTIGAFAQKTQFTCSLILHAWGKLNSWISKEFVVTEALCMVEPPHLWGKMGMRTGDDGHRFLEFHFWHFCRKAFSISDIFIFHIWIAQRQYIRRFPKKPGCSVLRFWGLSENEEKRKNPEFVDISSCIGA